MLSLQIRMTHLERMAFSVILLVCVGCGESDGPLLAEAGGVVTFNGKPVPAATVVFIPTAGSPAMGLTDDQGRFEFNTQGKPGAIVGNGTISITAVQQSRELTDEEMEKIGGAKFDALVASIRKSVIPEKYNHPNTSGLAITIAEDSEKNQLMLDLK
jgi:hypothetical protein